MLSTYKAVLYGNRLEWRDTQPAHLSADQPVAVYVTILDDTTTIPPVTAPGQQMAAILEQLAQIHAFAAISDPATWERDIRTDSDLPDRED